MTTNDYAAMAAEVLKRKPAVARPSELSRDRGIAIVAQAMKESSRARRRQRQWLAGSIAAVAAAAALAVVVFHGRSQVASSTKPASRCASAGPGCAVKAQNAHFAVDVGHSDGRDILPGGVIQADIGHPRSVDFDSGTRLSLGSNTMLAYDEGAQIHRFSLSRGSVHLEVAKLKPGQRFLVNTADAEVEVRGTVFDVSVFPAAASCEARTSVTVQEGVVEVRSADELQTLRPGDSWQERCHDTGTNADLTASGTSAPASGAKRAESEARTAAKASEPAANSLVDERTPAIRTVNTSTGESEAEVARLSDLAKQNDLYARASTARNQGNSVDALRLYQELITEYPSSALVESACVQRIRILKKTDFAGAAREAKQYLLRFPKGFARNEAEKVVNVP